jgi:hypothetical protein
MQYVVIYSYFNGCKQFSRQATVSMSFTDECCYVLLELKAINRCTEEKDSAGNILCTTVCLWDIESYNYYSSLLIVKPQRC